MTEILLRVTVLLLSAALIATVLRRSSAALRHLVWTLSLVGTLLIPLCAWVLPAWQWAILPQQQASAMPATATLPLPASPAVADDSPPAMRVGATRAPRPLDAPSPLPAATAEHAVIAPSATPVPNAEKPAVRTAPQATRSWSVFFAAVWAIGSFLGLAWIGVGMAAAWRVARRARPVSSSCWHDLVEQLIVPCGLRRPTEVRESTDVSVPMTWGLRRAVILVPSGSAAWPEPVKRSVLLHELGHIRRRDCLMLLLGRLASAAYWFHPLAWLAVRHMRKTSEEAADDLVLAAKIAPPDYAEHLVGIAGQMRGLRLFGHVALPMASRSDLEGRVKAILDSKRNHRSLRRKTCYVLMFVFALLLVPCAILRPVNAKGKKPDAPTAANNSGPAEKQPSPRTGGRAGWRELALPEARYKAARAKAEDDVNVRYATQATKVAYAEYEVNKQANDYVRGSVPQEKLNELLLECKEADLAVEKARRDQRIAGEEAKVAKAELERARQPDDRKAQRALEVAEADARYNVAKAKAEDDIDVRYATAATEVAKAEYEVHMKANVAVPGSVPQEKLNELLLKCKEADLAAEKARRDQRIAGEEAKAAEAELEAAKRKAADEHSAPADTKGTSEPGPAKSGTTNMRFELTILGPDKKPVPRCSVEVRSDVRPTEESVQQGTFTKKSSYGAMLQADASGVLILNLPQKPKRFVISIVQAGYGPYSAEWSSAEHPETIPSRFVVELEAAWSVGGIVVDSQGQPIEGAAIEPDVECKKLPADTRNLRCGTELTTDAEGKWRFDCVPVSSKAVFVEINDRNFQPADLSLPRTKFQIRLGGQPSAKIELQRGITVRGKIIDEAGKPIADALIRTVFRGQIRQAKTSESGTYQLRGCEPALARIVVSAKGRALDMKEVLLGPEKGSLDFQMHPGGKVRVRVLDEKGNPVAKAYVAIDGWRGLEYSESYFAFADVDPHADAGGVWQWNEAPLDEFKADICPPGGMRLEMQRLIARDEEYVFRTHPRLVVSGSVVDSKTRQPVKSFRVVPGIRRDDGPAGRPAEARIDWRTEGSYPAKDGKYRIERSREERAHVLRIEADGYRVAVSRDIKSDEGTVQVDFALVGAKDVAGTVLAPDGRPAAGAKIAIGVAGSQIMVKNGQIDRQTYAAQCDADESGRFQFPAQDGPFQLVIIHSAGFAYLKSAEQEIPSTIILTAWASVEGTFRVGSKTVPNARIEINSHDVNSYGDGVPNISTEFEATTGPGGQFVFERVFPGRGHIGRGILRMVYQGATEVTSQTMIAASFPAGKTTHIDLGGSGRQVVGKLAGPAGSNEKVLWQFAGIDADVDLPALKSPTVPADVEKDPARRKAWWTKWQATAEGKAWRAEYEKYDKLRRESPYIFATADRDGAFHIDDVPAGSYLLRVRFDEHSASHLSNYRFTVPPIDGGRASKPLDLGTLTLEKDK